MRLHIVIFRPILLEFCLPFFELNHYWRTNGGDWFYISSDTHTWCLYDRTLSLKCCRSWLVYHLECECAYTQRTRRRKPDWQRTMVFLTLLRTQLSLGGDAIDARCPPVERCWTEMFLSQMLRRWGMTSVERLDWVLFSAINIPLVQCWFCARIWRNMSRLRLWYLDAGLAAALWIVCCRWCDACTDAGTLVSSQWDIFVWLPNCCSSLHWGQILESIWLEGPKKWWSWCAHDELVMARLGVTVQAFLTVLMLRGHSIKKNEIFSSFQIFIEQASKRVYSG